MKLAVANETVERFNVGEEMVCKIATTANMFRILTNQYSNPIQSIIRELSANALDAHKDNGTADKPFDVHLPNRLEPFFSIRDYGTGIPHDKVVDIYLTYGCSTKDKSNDFIGGFGLGSKTPLTYVDAFNLTIWHNNKQCVFTVFLNENREPRVTKMDECEDNSPNGLQVNFPVQAKDFQLFANAASSVYQWFKLMPNVTGNQIKLEPKTVYYEDDNFAIFTNYNGGSAVLMGQVHYPIDSYHFKYDASDMLRNGLLLKVNIGDVEVTPTREHLLYSDLTKNAIVKKITELKTVIVKHIEGQLASSKTILDAKLSYAQIPHYIRTGVNTIPKWNKQDIKLEIDLECTRLRPSGYNNKVKRTLVSKIYLTDKPVVIFSKDIKGGVARVRQYAMEHKGEDVHLVEPTLITPEVAAIVKLSSSLPKVVTAKSANRGKTVNIWQVDAGIDIVKSSSYDYKKKGGVYFIKFAQKIEMFGKNYGYGDIYRVLLSINDLGVKLPTIYGVSKKRAAKLSKKWVLIDNLIVKYVKQYEHLIKRKEYDDGHSYLLTWLSGLKKKLAGTKAADIVSSYDKAKLSGDDDQYDALVALAKYSNYKLTHEPKDLDELQDKMYALYPMLRCSTTNSVYEKEILDYIKLVEATK